MEKDIKKMYYCGKVCSEYGIKNNRVDYRTLASFFDTVLCNSIVEVDPSIFGNIISGEYYYYYDENDNEITEEEFCEKMKNGEEAYENEIEIYQYYIVSDNAVDYLKDANELVLYSDMLDCYIWCVDHFGTAWDYVLTTIKIDENMD